MILRHLTIRNFRNLADIDLELAPGVTLFFGRNAQGKTNILEAVHYLATGRSFRTRVDREALPWAAEGKQVGNLSKPGAEVEQVGDLSKPGAVARIEGRVERRDTSHTLAVALTERAKFAWVDGKALGRLGDLLGTLMVVLFTPEDIRIASGAPAIRRHYLDVALAQASPAYLAALQGYSEALRQRNAALRDPARWASVRGAGPLGDPWAGLLVEHGVAVTLARREALRAIAGPAADAYSRIAPDDARLVLTYRAGARIGPDDDREAAREKFRKRLAETAETERLRAQTITGPHRDDFELTIGDREVRDYASMGQQRSVALSLRLAELQWMARQAGEPPVLLVDDLGSELDRDRQCRLLTLFGAGVQTLATTAGDPDSLGRMMGADRAIEVDAGALSVVNKSEK
jgi:DNA replication and repair protein RecF